MVTGVGDYFAALQQKLSSSLAVVDVLEHPGGKGDEAEVNWAGLLSDHLPGRYQVITKCKIVDHDGRLSDEIDIALCDRQYSTLILQVESRAVVPAEAVYAVFEVKQTLNREHVLYAADKAASVRSLKRTSAAIVDARGLIDSPREPSPIIAGILAARSDWSPGLGTSFEASLAGLQPSNQLDIGCVLQAGGWEASYTDGSPGLVASDESGSLAFFYIGLLRLLQRVGTVPAMDLDVWFAREQPRD